MDFLISLGILFGAITIGIATIIVESILEKKEKQ